MSGEATDPIPDRGLLESDYERRKSSYQAAIEDMERLVRDRLEAEGLRPTIKGRIKSFDSLYKKRIRLLRQAMASGAERPLPINDIIGLRVVCPFLGDLAEAERILSRDFRVLETERKGADRSFREFGYESIHLLVALPPELGAARSGLDVDACEIQLRTILQEAWAEVEHELVYKAEFTPFDEPMKRKLAALNANLSLSDIIFQEIREYQRRLSEELARRRSAFYSKIEEAIDQPFGSAMADGRPSRPAACQDRSVDDRSAAASLDDLLLDALYAHNRGDYAEAIAIYGRILENSPPKEAAAVVTKHRGMAYFSQSRYEEAVQDFSRTLELDGDCYKAAYFRGVVRSVQGQYGKAVEDFDLALRINPYQFFAIYRRAQAYWHLGDYPKVVADCETANRILPGRPEVMELKSLAMEKLDLLA
ncbi:MAG TPA: tetratricopeptide repeat protein [Spirochaetales bacterium]|nr:tetratricopeptide repeat protein [Spirochaetales bacterium]